MRLRCYLRRYRGDRSLGELSALTGIAKGELSMLERGRLLPADEWLPALVAAYGVPVDEWYEAGARRATHVDIRRCGGCGDELSPDASRRRMFHGDACRRLASRSAAKSAR